MTPNLEDLFKQIGHYNLMIGNPSGFDRSGPELMAAVQTQLKLVEDEFAEMVGSVQAWLNEPCESNWNDIKKEYADVLVTLAGFSHRAGFLAFHALGKVHGNNMSKFIPQDQIEANQDFYRTLEVQVMFRPCKHPGTGETLYAIVSTHDQKDIYGTHYRAGKQLKPVTFEELDWTTD